MNSFFFHLKNQKKKIHGPNHLYLFSKIPTSTSFFNNGFVDGEYWTAIVKIRKYNVLSWSLRAGVELPKHDSSFFVA